jgi:hypothetical protein
VGALHETAATLRFFGDDLDPDEISARLGAIPTVGVRKGGTWTTDRGVSKPARTGSWRLEMARRQPGDLDGLVAELLGMLTEDLAVWEELTTRFSADLFCGLFMREGNEGLSLSPETMQALGSRRLLLGLDIHGAGTQDGK